MKACIISLALLPGMAGAQSSREEAWRWCARRDATIALNAQLAGCNWIIRSGQETAESLSGAYFNRGNARAELWDFVGAIADFTEAIRLNPEFISAFNNRGNARADQGDLNGAIADFSEAIRLNPQHVSAFNNRGFTRAQQGDRAGAITDFSEAIRLAPQDAGAFNNRGFARFELGDYAAAINDFTEAIRLEPGYARALTGRAIARGATGDHAGAIADFDEVLRLDPQNAGAFAARAVASHRLGNTDTARADLESATRVAGARDGWPYAARAALALLRDDRDAVTLELTQAWLRNPNDSLTMALLAILQNRQGDVAGASANAAAARRNWPSIGQFLVGFFGPELVLP
ncbi:MAG: tetratricopeptide repeat protein [Roseomonas sp.]|nr:tetratricopeptide repeat protein [Roseomonas sp.]